MTGRPITPEIWTDWSSESGYQDLNGNVKSYSVEAHLLSDGNVGVVVSHEGNVIWIAVECTDSTIKSTPQRRFLPTVLRPEYENFQRILCYITNRGSVMPDPDMSLEEIHQAQEMCHEGSNSLHR